MKSKRIKMQCRACGNTVKVKRTKVERRIVEVMVHKGCTALGLRHLEEVK